MTEEQIAEIEASLKRAQIKHEGDPMPGLTKENLLGLLFAAACDAGGVLRLPERLTELARKGSVEVEYDHINGAFFVRAALKQEPPHG